MQRDGYVAIGAEHGRHNKTASLPASTIVNIRPFLPPELIIQDELHLITGPLGTVYGAYETIIEDMCIHDGIKPKYVVFNSHNQECRGADQMPLRKKEYNAVPAERI